MAANGTLRRRIVLACVILAGVLCAVYALVVVVSLKAIEDRLLNDRLAEAAGQLIANHLHGFRNDVPGDPQVFEDAAIPVAWRGFDAGVHEVSAGGRVLHVLVHEQGGRRFAVVDEERKKKRIERQVGTAEAGAIKICKK